ncbi:MAG: hypothetical protein AAF693_19320 [Bacteroidota bacterium]
MFRERTITSIEGTLDGVKVYPNPTKDTLYIKGTGKMYVELISETGQSLVKTSIKDLGRIDLSGFQNKNLVLRITQLGKTNNYRIIN